MIWPPLEIPPVQPEWIVYPTTTRPPCPGCGRCRTCGQPAPVVPAPIPWVSPMWLVDPASLPSYTYTTQAPVIGGGCP